MRLRSHVDAFLCDDHMKRLQSIPCACVLTREGNRRYRRSMRRERAKSALTSSSPPTASAEARAPRRREKLTNDNWVGEKRIYGCKSVP